MVPTLSSSLPPWLPFTPKADGGSGCRRGLLQALEGDAHPTRSADHAPEGEVPQVAVPDNILHGRWVCPHAARPRLMEHLAPSSNGAPVAAQPTQWDSPVRPLISACLHPAAH